MTMNRTFRGRTLSEARDAAEAALGPDVVVLQRRKVKKDGLTGMLGLRVMQAQRGIDQHQRLHPLLGQTHLWLHWFQKRYPDRPPPA
jgi:flagellar biosynthesis GTPase FlhF